MIEDKEMREIFKVESQEHLQHLNDGLLHLEKDLNDQMIIKELFREAHSLKGSARMLGLGDIETITHKFEHILNQSLKKNVLLSPAMVEALYRSLDAVRDLVEEAISGVSKGTRVSEVLGLLDDPEKGQVPREAKMAPDPVTSSTKMDRPGRPEEQPPPDKGDPEGETAPSTTSPENSFRIDTIRVETQKLDQLMTHVGELIVAKLRFSRRPPEIEEMLETWDGLRQSLSSALTSETSLKERFDRFSRAFEKLRGHVAEDHARLEFITGGLEEGVRAIRLLPLSTIFCLFPRMVRDLSHDQGKETDFRFEGGETTADKRILEELKDPLMHVIRNAIDHGIELPQERETRGKPRQGSILLKAFRTESMIVIEVRDDGRGLDTEKIKRAALKQRLLREEELNAMSEEQIHFLIFSPGLTTSSFVSDVSGRGVGLDVVRAKTELLKGTVSVHSVAGESCTIRMALPITLATARVLLLVSAGITYALPLEFVLKSCFFPKSELFSMEGRETVLFENQAISVARLSDLLTYKTATGPTVSRTESTLNREKNSGSGAGEGEKRLPCIILSVGQERFGLFVDELKDEQEIILKPQSDLLKRVVGISGATILGTGEVCMILHPPDLLRSLRARRIQGAAAAEGEQRPEKKIILLAEDTMTTRIQMKRILEGAGYEVVPAVDGADALGKLETKNFDALVTDIMMPNMDGLTLTAKIRQNRKYRELPIILVTSLDSGEDKRKGAEAGANAYLTKPAFDQKILLDTLRRLV